VTAVASARQALESFAGDGSRRPDILVGADGAANQQLLKRIRAAEPTRVNGNTLPAIVISEKDGKNPRRRALKAGYQDLIAKPINPDQLVAAAARLTGRGQAG
jgi:CheY-like chemotaxis protein